MTASVRDVLAAFDALGPTEKREVLVEVLRRSPGDGSVSDEGLDALASEVFHGYDAEEAQRAEH
jgi:hypothetical protein